MPRAFNGMSASRGTYNVTGTTFVRRHIADTDPNLEDKLSTGTFALKGDTFTWQGTDAAGQKFSATYTRMTAIRRLCAVRTGRGTGTRRGAGRPGTRAVKYEWLRAES